MRWKLRRVVLKPHQRLRGQLRGAAGEVSKVQGQRAAASGIYRGKIAAEEQRNTVEAQHRGSGLLQRIAKIIRV